MKVADIGRYAPGTVCRDNIGRQLDRITGHKSRCETEAACCLNQQPGRIATASAPDRQCIFRRLHARFHADHIVDPLVYRLIETDEEIDGAFAHITELLNEGIEQRALCIDIEISGEIGRDLRCICERPILCIILNEEVERIDHDEVGDQVNRNRKLVGPLRKNQPCQPVAVRILLPVDEVVFGRDAQRIVVDRSPAVRCGPQTYYLGTEQDRLVVTIARLMVQRRLNHGGQSQHIPLCSAMKSSAPDNVPQSD